MGGGSAAAALACVSCRSASAATGELGCRRVPGPLVAAEAAPTEGSSFRRDRNAVAVKGSGGRGHHEQADGKRSRLTPPQGSRAAIGASHPRPRNNEAASRRPRGIDCRSAALYRSRATRKPRRGFVVCGPAVRRNADRAWSGLLAHEAPRSTRLPQPALTHALPSAGARW